MNTTETDVTTTTMTRTTTKPKACWDYSTCLPYNIVLPDHEEALSQERVNEPPDEEEAGCR
jgi:hypothetical protein